MCTEELKGKHLSGTNPMLIERFCRTNIKMFAVTNVNTTKIKQQTRIEYIMQLSTVSVKTCSTRWLARHQLQVTDCTGQ